MVRMRAAVSLHRAIAELPCLCTADRSITPVATPHPLPRTSATRRRTRQCMRGKALCGHAHVCAHTHPSEVELHTDLGWVSK